ncbi:MAG: hypothetical protein ACREMC_06190 [Gemmatimonadales bacterium]
MRATQTVFFASLAVVASCSNSDSRNRGWHEVPPALTVSVRGPAEAATAWATVEAVPAPEVQFSALIRPDPNHVSPVVSPVSGLIVRIRPERHARRREVLAVVGQGSREAGREVPVAAERDGIWHPRRQQRQLVWQNDTLGVLEEHGYWLAVGTVSDLEFRTIHPGDPASVQLAPDRHAGRPGKVEWVRPPWRETPYSADIAVEFRASETSRPDAWGPITVTVAAGPGDTVAAVPPSAVVQLPLGPAVFVPIGNGIYEVRWISTGPTAHGLIIAREGVSPGTSVVTRGLVHLVAAARDSLALRERSKP